MTEKKRSSTVFGKCACNTSRCQTQGAELLLHLHAKTTKGIVLKENASLMVMAERIENLALRKSLSYALPKVHWVSGTYSFFFKCIFVEILFYL